jgi:hypothetical protein
VPPLVAPLLALLALRSSAAVVDLPVAGFGDAVVSVPVGATEKRPVVVALHGYRFRPDWECRNARELFGNRAFVLCPRGVKAPATPGDRQERFTFRGIDDVQKEIAAGLSALSAAYPGYVDTDSRVFYGHSLGAYLGVMITLRDPQKWPLAIFHEGGFGWSVETARAFKKRGGKRVVLACGTKECAAGAKISVRALEAGGVGAKLVDSQESGHHNFGPIIDEIADAVPWLIEGDSRFGS